MSLDRIFSSCNSLISLIGDSFFANSASSQLLEVALLFVNIRHQLLHILRRNFVSLTKKNHYVSNQSLPWEQQLIKD